MASKESDKSASGPGNTSKGASPQSAVPRPGAAKAVERAAKAGGGRSRAQNSTSWGYLGTLLGISVVGIGLIATSFLQQREDSNAPYRQTQERSQAEFKLVSDARKKFKDNPKSAALKKAEKRYEDYLSNSHIHAAYGIYDCTKDKGKEWVEPIDGTGDPDITGIHAHEDGLLHVHPFVKTVTGRRAVLGRWMDTIGVKVSDKRIFVPAKGPTPEAPQVKVQKEIELKSGVKCKNGKESVIRVFEYKDAVVKGVADKDAKGKRALGSAKDVPLKSGWAYVIARVDKDFIPAVPPSVEALQAPSDAIAANDQAPADPTTQNPTVVDPAAVPSTAVGSPTTAVGSPTTTGGATTVKPATATTTVKSSAAATTVKP